MDIGKYIGIDYDKTYTTNELNNILSKFNNLDIAKFDVDGKIRQLLQKYDASATINFINMFKNINDLGMPQDETSYRYSLAAHIMLVITRKSDHDKLYVYKIVDHLLKISAAMNTEIIYVKRYISTCGIDFINNNWSYFNYWNRVIVVYIHNNFSVIQNVRKIINNYDIILFDITDDLQFIKQTLLITKSKHKNLPKFIITHKILYYYLLDKNQPNV